MKRCMITLHNIYFEDMSRKYREDRDIFEIYHPEALIFTFFSLFGPLAAMFDIFYNLFFWEMIPLIIKCNP